MTVDFLSYLIYFSKKPRNYYLVSCVEHSWIYLFISRKIWKEIWNGQSVRTYVRPDFWKMGYISGQIGNAQSVRWQFWISRQTGYFLNFKNCVTLEIRNLNICRLFCLDISSSSRDKRENRKWSICTTAILNFPAKQDAFLKIKELCHQVHKTLEQTPFKFLRYLI